MTGAAAPPSPEDIRTMAQNMATDVGKLQEPSWKNMADPAWREVDKIIKTALDWLKEKGLERPLDDLSLELVRMSFEDLDRGLQTVAWRILDTRLLVYENRRLRAILASDEPWNLSLPEHGWQVPPSVGYSFYKGGTKEGLEMIVGELADRGLGKRPKKEEVVPLCLSVSSSKT